MAKEHWRVPIRLDLAGGTLDLWPIYAILGDCVTVNLAVDLWIELDFEWEGPGHHLLSRDAAEEVHWTTWPKKHPAALSWIWRVLDAGGRYPARLDVHSPVPKGSGLGVSSCLAVGLWGAAHGLEAGSDLAAVIPFLRDLEARELKTPTGMQDYFPPALGGTLAIEWELPYPVAEPLELHPDLADRMVLFYTGMPHHSGLTNWEAYRRFIDGDPVTRGALRDIRDISRNLKKAVSQDVEATAELLEREGQARTWLSPAVETELMRRVRDKGRREGWYVGMKPCGAGGGGCCLLMTPQDRKPEALAALRAMDLLVLEAQPTSLGLHRV